MAAILNELATWLQTQGVGVVHSNIFYGSTAVIPSGIGPYLQLHETGGGGSKFVQDSSRPNTELPTVQVVVRAKLYNDARGMAKAARDAFNAKFNITIGTTFYQSIKARQNITDLGKDSSNRVMLVFNLEIEKDPE
jgi:hypothetical protein